MVTLCPSPFHQVPTLKYILGKYFPKHSEPLLDQEGTITRYSVDTDGASPLHYATIMSPCQDMLQVLLLEVIITCTVHVHLLKNETLKH